MRYLAVPEPGKRPLTCTYIGGTAWGPEVVPERDRGLIACPGRVHIGKLPS